MTNKRVFEKIIVKCQCYLTVKVFMIIGHLEGLNISYNVCEYEQIGRQIK